MSEEKLQELAEGLYSINAVKFGNFATKSGVRTPVYFDLRVIVSYPSLMQKISEVLYEFAVKDTSCDHLCGVPYTALPIATLVSIRSGKSMLMRRKEAKAYGTKRMIEGHYKPGETCLIIEDVVTSGSSVLETVNDLKKEGLVTEEAIVIVNREQGAVKALEASGVRTRALFTITDLVKRLIQAGKIESSFKVTLAEYLENTQISLNNNAIEKPNRLKMSFESRSQYAKNAVSKQLLEIMSTKETNLCISVDMTTTSAILDLLEKIGPHVCLVKTHVDIIEDFTSDFVSNLVDLGKKHNFLIMEDRKYADIGNTVMLQYSKGLYRVAEWADLVTAHSLPGDGVLKGLASAANERGPRGVFLLAEMSCENNLITADYTLRTMSLASQYAELVSGVVCQSGDVVQEPGLIQLTPGVGVAQQDSLGQKYRTPEEVMESGADIAVVGRGIVAAKNPEGQALWFKQTLWQAYLNRINN